MNSLALHLMRTRKLSRAQAELLEAKIFREQAERAAKKKAERAKAEPELPFGAPELVATPDDSSIDF